MPHGNAQGAGLCVLSHETCMPPLTSTHKHPTYWPERRHRTHPRPLTGSRSRAARPRARQPRTPRAACRTPCALPQRSRPGPPPGTTSHGAQRPRTDGHTRTTYRARRACPCDRARARRALRAMRRARRRLWPAHRAPTTPPTQRCAPPPQTEGLRRWSGEDGDARQTIAFARAAAAAQTPHTCFEASRRRTSWMAPK